MTPARFRWGILFILVGLLLLLNNLGYISWWVWEDILSLWPVLLIVLGVEKIFTKTRFQAISYLTSLALAGAVLWAAFAGGIGYRTDRGVMRYQVDTDDRVDRIEARVEIKNTDLDIRGTDRYLFLSNYDGWGSNPDVDYEVLSGTAKIDFEERKRWSTIHIKRSRSDDFNLSFDRRLPLILDIHGRDGDIKVDGRRLKLEEIEIYSESGWVRIYTSPSQPVTRLSLSGETADFRLNIPADAGLKIYGETSEMAGLLKKLNLSEKDGVYYSEGYDSLELKVDISVGEEISRLSINRY